MSKGKNFSTNNTGKRRKSDFYETPYSITRHLLAVEQFPNQILEPACGDGAIVKVLIDHGYSVTAYDKEVDFLTETNTYESVITNPPFSLAKEFIQKCNTVCSNKFALLLPLSYLHGKSRYDSFYSNNNIGLKSVYVFTRYPMLGEPIRADGKYNTGMMVYAWYVFEKSYSDEPVLRWIDNNSDVLKKHEIDPPYYATPIA